MIRKPLPSAPDPFERWNLLGARALAEPLPPVPWVCEPLGLAPGAVSLVAGYGYSRKTMALQSLGLAVAAKCPVWGLWSARPGRFVHLDYEQGRRLTQERYQRLARGMGFDLRDLEDGALRVACMPRVYIEDDAAVEELARIVEGATLAIVDSLRAAFPHADENSSEVRSYLDALTRVSERTGVAFVLIHHARKPAPMAGGTATHSIRGSGALFDACQSVYVFEGEKDTPTKVHHQKDRVRGATLPEFGLVSEDVSGASGPRDGLVVRHLELEEVEQAESRRGEAKREECIATAGARIIETVGASGFKGSRRDLRSVVGGKGEMFEAAFTRLLNDGILVRSGSKHEPHLKLG